MKKINIKLDNKTLHLVVIILGMIFTIIPIFHINLWFDESYSVALAGHSFKEIWTIGGHDVHPILYYVFLHIINLIFGNNIIAYRILSWMFIVLTGILGYTHIRKEFGEKTGVLFSFLCFFMPGIALYSGEIRMYSLGLLLGTIMSIYAYRIYKSNIQRSTLIIFGISSLALAYTHYYGLMLAGIENFVLFIYLIIKYKERKKDLIKFLIIAISQVLAYIPWLLNFITQLKGVSSGFWITLKFPDTLYEVLTTQLKGNLDIIFAVITTVIFYIYLTYIYIKTRNKNENFKAINLAIILYISIILIALIISLVMQSILLYRYLIVITGLMIFTISAIMAKERNKYIILAICICITIMSLISTYYSMKEAYNKNNTECVNYIKENIKEDDIIVYSNAINGAVITTELSRNKSYFYDKDNWNVDEAYKAFSPYMEIKDTLEEILDNYQGRVWLVEGGDTHNLYNEIIEKYNNVTKIEDKQFKQEYKDYKYTIKLLELQGE